MAIKARFPLLLLLLGIVLLALVCVSSGISHPCHEKCLKKCNRVNEASSHHECRSRCEGWPERCEEEEEEEEDERPWHKEHGRRERGRQEGEREEEERRHRQPRRQEEEEGQQPRPGGRRERGRQEGEREEEERRRQPRRQEEEEGQQRHGQRQSQQEREEEGQWQPQREREREERQPRRQHQEEEEGLQRPKQRWQRREREGEEEEEGQLQPRREREQEERQKRPEHRRPRHEEEQEVEEEESRGRSRHHEDPDEWERARLRRERRQEQEGEQGQRHRHRESEEEEGSSSSSESQRRRNPFFFSSNTFQTLFENENGRIRLLQRFDKRNNLFQNLKNYRILEYRSKPRTLFLPQHIDADSILVVLSGRAIFTVVNPNNRNSFNLERGDAIRLPAGTTAYLANRDDNEDLRVVDLAIPINRPGQFQSFFPSSSQNQQSYFNEFSREILEASFNTNYKEIERVLLEDQQEGRQQRTGRGRRERQQSQEPNPIVKVSREQIEELSRNAKSSSKKSSSSESQPFNLRSRDPKYSNKFGRFFEITPEKNPQLQDLNLFLSSVEIKEGGIMLPHYNSRAFVILVINEGKGHIELVAQRNEQQQRRRQRQQQREEDEDEDEDEDQQEQEEDQRSGQLQRYRARLSSGDVFVIPSSNPVAVNASSNLNFIAFGINAENNQRNFLAGEDDNVISQIHRPVKELVFPGSAQEVEKLLKNQRQSYFASAQPQQREEESQRRRGPLSSILEAFY